MTAPFEYYINTSLQVPREKQNFLKNQLTVKDSTNSGKICFVITNNRGFNNQVTKIHEHDFIFFAENICFSLHTMICQRERRYS